MWSTRRGHSLEFIPLIERLERLLLLTAADIASFKTGYILDHNDIEHAHILTCMPMFFSYDVGKAGNQCAGAP